MRVWTEVDKSTGVAYTIDLLPEETAVKGNAMASGDDAVDRRAEQWIYRQLAKGNAWAWCTVKVTASQGESEGVDYLGCCSYTGLKQFLQPDGYWDDMKSEAFARLQALQSSGVTA